jgi:hypothetical protein
MVGLLNMRVADLLRSDWSLALVSTADNSSYTHYVLVDCVAHFAREVLRRLCLLQ